MLEFHHFQTGVLVGVYRQEVGQRGVCLLSWRIAGASFPNAQNKACPRSPAEPCSEGGWREQDYDDCAKGNFSGGV